VGGTEAGALEVAEAGFAVGGAVEAGEAVGLGVKCAGASVTLRGAGEAGGGMAEAAVPSTRSPAASLRPLMPAITFLEAGFMLEAGCLQLKLDVEGEVGADWVTPSRRSQESLTFRLTLKSTGSKVTDPLLTNLTSSGDLLTFFSK